MVAPRASLQLLPGLDRPIRHPVGKGDVRPQAAEVGEHPADRLDDDRDQVQGHFSVGHRDIRNLLQVSSGQGDHPAMGPFGQRRDRGAELLGADEAFDAGRDPLLEA